MSTLIKAAGENKITELEPDLVVAVFSPLTLGMPRNGLELLDISAEGRFTVEGVWLHDSG